MRQIVNIEDFGIRADQGEDVSLAVLEAIEHCKKLDQATLYFPKGDYHFWPTLAYEKLYYISNHDEDVLKRIAFPIINHKNFIIEGESQTDTSFIFHGLIIPFALEASQDIQINNISIDWERPRISQGRVIASTPETLDIEISHDYPYKIINNHLYFNAEGLLESFFALLEIDQHKLSFTYASGDNCLGIEGLYEDLYVEEIKQGVIRLRGNFTRLLRVHNYVIMRHGKRVNPGIFIQDCKNISLNKINIYHAGGMGVIAQKSETIYLKEVNVMRAKGSKRVFTAFADASHFVLCKGLITIENCLFENQLDDATNVHGIYLKITKIIDNDRIIVKLMHHQHKGVKAIGIEDEVGFIKSDTLLTYEKAKVKDVKTINRDYMIISLDKPLSINVEEGDCIENITWNPDLLIKGCTIRANRARGLLVSTPGKVVIENNTISVPGAAIKISGDANLWYESGAVNNVLIRNNHFIDCNYCYGPWGKSIIDIDPEIKETKQEIQCYHSNIIIENNIFETFGDELVKGYSVKNLCVRDNSFIKTSTYAENECR